MGFFYSSKAQTRQPLVPKINRQNQITQGLTALVNAGPGLKGDLVTNTPAWTYTPTEFQTKSGRGVGQSTVGTNGVWWDRASNGQPTVGPTAFRPSSQILSLVVVYTPLDWVADATIFATSAGSDGYRIAGRFTDGTLQITLNDGSTRVVQSPSGKAVIGELNVIVVTCDGSTLELFSNGVSQGTAATGGGAISYDASFSQTALGGAATPFGNNGAPGAYYYAAVYNRVLTKTEIASLYTNPWQLVAASRKQIWVPTAGGNVSVTLTSIELTSSLGTIKSAISELLSGNSATLSRGTLVSSLSSSLSGQAITSSTGTIKSAISYTLTGSAATFSAGTITASTGGAVSVNLTGSAATASQGTIVAAIATALSGSFATVSRGTITPTVGPTLSGSVATISSGTLTSAISRSLSGSSATFSTGTLSVLSGATITIKAGSWIRYKVI